MIEHKLGNSIPSRVVRFGVRHHGLVLTHAIKHPVFTQYQIFFNDVRITTRAGKVIQYPLIPEKVGANRGIQLDAKLGPSCVYMHPNASMQVEDSEGNDWSGYIVFSLTDAYRTSRLVGYNEYSLFAYTPSDNSLGVLIELLDPRRVRIKNKPLIVGEESIGNTQDVEFDGGVVGAPIFASKTGREIYFGGLPTPLKIINEINYPDWSTTGSPKVNKVTISDTFDEGGNVQYSASVEQIGVTVADESTIDGYEIITYKTVTVSSPFVGACVAPADATVRVNTFEWNHLDPPPGGGGTSVVKLIDTYSLSRKKSVIAASISDEGAADFLSFLFEEYRKTDGGGDAQASGSVTTGESCDDGRGVRITGTEVTTSTQFSMVAIDRTRATLDGYGGSSTVELRFDSTRSDSYNSRVINGTEPEPPIISSDSSDTFTIEMDGAVLFSGSGYSDAKQEPIYDKPILPSFYMTAPQGNFFGARLEETGERKTGTKYLIASARVCDYGSRDLSSLMVVIETFSLIKQGDRFVVNQASYKAEVFIGKTFGRGIIDDYTHYEDITGASNYYLCRAYDPVDKKISPVYPYPVFYQ